MKKGTYSLAGETFCNVGGDTNTLKSIAANSSKGTFRSGNFYISFFNVLGDPSIVSDDETMKVFNPTAYEQWGEKDLKFWTDKEHWYLTADTGKTIVMDDYPIAPGRGFNVYVGSLGDLGVDVTYSGQVEAKDITLNLAKGTYNLSANVSPVEIKFKDLTIEAAGTLRAGNFYIAFFNSLGDPGVVSDDETMQTFSPDAYSQWGDRDLRFWTDKEHWYLTADTGKTIQMDNYPIASGRGFSIYVGSVNGGVKVSIPSALQDAEKAE